MLPSARWQDVTGRQGTTGLMRPRFAMQRVCPAHRDSLRTEPRAERWLLVGWPEGEADPTRYWLSTRGPTIAIEARVHEAKLRRRIQRDDQEMKDALGLDHVEGRGWRTVHHHAT